MQRFGVLALVTMAGMLAPACSVSSAQNVSQGTESRNSPSVMITSTVPGSDCPVGISARRGVGGGAVAIDRDDPRARANSGEASQQLQILMFNLKSIGITAAQITAHGTAPGGRVIPVPSRSPNEAISRTVSLKLAVGPGERVSTGMRLSGFTSVALLDLDSVTYADGSSWHSAAGHTCQIAPNGFMLVDGGSGH